MVKKLRLMGLICLLLPHASPKKSLLCEIDRREKLLNTGVGLLNVPTQRGKCGLTVPLQRVKSMSKNLGK